MAKWRHVNPDDLVYSLGRTFVRHLHEHVLVIGKDKWTKTELATSLGIVHMSACRKVSQVAKSLGATSTADLYHKTSPYELAGHAGLGVTTLYALFAAFANKGLDIEKWYKASDDESRGFFTLKHHATAKDRAAEAQTKLRGRK